MIRNDLGQFLQLIDRFEEPKSICIFNSNQGGFCFCFSEKSNFNHECLEKTHLVFIKHLAMPNSNHSTISSYVASYYRRFCERFSEKMPQNPPFQDIITFLEEECGTKKNLYFVFCDAHLIDNNLIHELSQIRYFMGNKFGIILNFGPNIDLLRDICIKFAINFDMIHQIHNSQHNCLKQHFENVIQQYYPTLGRVSVPLVHWLVEIYTPLIGSRCLIKKCFVILQKIQSEFDSDSGKNIQSIWSHFGSNTSTTKLELDFYDVSKDEAKMIISIYLASKNPVESYKLIFAKEKDKNKSKYNKNYKLPKTIMLSNVLYIFKALSGYFGLDLDPSWFYHLYNLSRKQLITFKSSKKQGDFIIASNITDSFAAELSHIIDLDLKKYLYSECFS